MRVGLLPTAFRTIHGPSTMCGNSLNLRLRRSSPGRRPPPPASSIPPSSETPSSPPLLRGPRSTKRLNRSRNLHFGRFRWKKRFRWEKKRWHDYKSSLVEGRPRGKYRAKIWLLYQYCTGQPLLPPLKSRRGWKPLACPPLFSRKTASTSFCFAGYTYTLYHAAPPHCEAEVPCWTLYS